MDRNTEERWRTALQKQGQDAVRQRLDLRPGPQSELFYDIVDEPPYPDRAFCEAWCRGPTQRKSGISGAGVMVIIMSVLFVVCGLRAFTSSSKQDANWLAPNGAAFHHPSPTAASPTGAAGNSDTTIGFGAVQNQATQNSSVINTQGQSSLLSGCTTVSSANNLATVQRLKPCSKLSAQVGMQGSTMGAGSSGSSGGGVGGALGTSSSDTSSGKH
jgi:hypothetical protein